MPEPIPFIADILSQPAALRALPQRDILERVLPVRGRLLEFDRIVLTGMGASLAALRPLWLDLLGAGRAAWWIDTAELLAEGVNLLGRTTLVIAASQSGRSGEIVALTRESDRRGSFLLAISNDLEGPLALAATLVVPIAAGTEHAVSTRTYLNTIAAGFLVGSALAGRDAADAIEQTADGLDAYLGNWNARLQEVTEAIGLPERLCIVGRGASLAAAQCGSLILKEAAKWPSEAQSAAQFRHGPLELADPRLTVLVLSGGDSLTRDRNRLLAHDLAGAGARAVWIDDRPGPASHLSMPPAAPELRPIAEIVPLQLLCVSIADQTGIEPGRFRHITKVTTAL